MLMLNRLFLCGLIVAPMLVQADEPAATARFVSHPARQQSLPLVDRPLGAGRSYFVDSGRGDDAGAGTLAAPWKTVGHAVRQLHTGDTLCLREGVYHENVSVSLAGRADAPITIRGYPGERAILDGSLSEFMATPADCWEPVADGAPDEYRSRRTYPNLRDVVGSFGDSLVGLQTYYHARDLRAGNELVDWEDWSRPQETDLKPLYCGPGLWYDRATSRIHVRLAHTHLPEPIANYRGETDPRRVPLILAPFASTPLRVDGAEYVRFQDLTIRGGGYQTVVCDQSHHIELDRITLWCGTYGIRATGLQHFRLTNSAVYGSLAPWTFRADASKRDYPGRPHRNISRLNTHALVEIEAGRESSVYAWPQNDQWEIAHCHFADAHDGLYLGGINCRFHHNLIEGLQDDGLYLSPMYLRHRLEKTDPQIHVYQNEFRGALTALAFGGSEANTHDRVLVYRNLFDLRGRIDTGRPSTKDPKPNHSFGKIIGDHGSPPWPSLTIYHNTFVMRESSRDVAMGTTGSNRPGHERRVFNNVFLHEARLPGHLPSDPALDVIEDGNLYWSPLADSKQAASLFAKFRASDAFAKSRERYTAGSTTNSLVANPQFQRVSDEATQAHDYRPIQGSPALDVGIAIPAEWPDPVRDSDSGKPDIGAFPVGVERWRVGP